jgi:1-acyl-sn-glycerol-3-phosphate acyltransferase
LAFLIDPEIAARVDRLELPFNRYGVDPYGISKEYLGRMFSFLAFMSRHYFSVGVVGVEHVPARGRAMLIGNHSGGVAIDGSMVVATCFLEKEPPRLAQGMAEKFIAKFPFFNQWTARTGQFTGLPETAAHLLEDERLLMVFPEGARGTAKLYPERHSLVHFGSGFVRLALKTKSPIIPFGFVGGGEAIPTIANSYALGRLMGVPYIPITPWIFTIPAPVRLELTYGEPMIFEGTGTEDDEVIEGYVQEVKDRIAALIEIGRHRRRQVLSIIPRGDDDKEQRS